MSPNANYVRGRRFEYTRKKAWEAQGCICVRTAGSHGPWDIIAVKPGFGVFLIQCKSVQTHAQATRIIADFTQNPPLQEGKYAQGIEVWVKDTRKLESWYL